MPLKQGSTNVVRLYKREVEGLKYVYYGTSTPPGANPWITFEDPDGQSCSIDGEWVGYNSGSGTVFYLCQEVVSTHEVTHLKDNQNRSIHKRVTITFNANGGSGGSTQTRTWGVEQITQPASPTRSGYDFQGWATTSGATSPNVTFPRSTPENDITYYAVWQQQSANLTWQYRGPTGIRICACQGVPMIGTACSVQGQTMIRCASDEGYDGDCIVIECKY